jgi:hypothetical protein
MGAKVMIQEPRIKSQETKGKKQKRRIKSKDLKSKIFAVRIKNKKPKTTNKPLPRLS